jgi:2-keto-4-pentenoate hydratase/2-oxohepta-3-ene-1,7-dioic acid hydratase in catechol pathway
MKLVRFGEPWAERPGLLDRDGTLRDLSGVIPDLAPQYLSRACLLKLGKTSPSSLPPVDGQPRLGVPIAAVGKFIAIGLNYADHAAEAGLPLSRFMTLMPGDVIATGTPPGVGMGKKPHPIYLKPGDIMTLGIEGLGTQVQHVKEWYPMGREPT